MSFSSKAKNEMCRDSIAHKTCAIAECLGIALFCNTFRPGLLKIVTENEAFAGRIPKLFKKAFGVSFTDSTAEIRSGGKFVFQLTDNSSLSAVNEAFGFNPEGERSIHLNYNVIEDSACAQAFLRGAFLAGGSVTDPGKRYHLELSTTHRTACLETFSLMLDMDLSPKDTLRNGNSVIYFKQSEAIEDFLTAAGAPVCAMEIMEAKVEKELVNKVNRQVNCETANLSKVVDAAQSQLNAIRLLKEQGLFDTLSTRLRDTAELREQNPEATLAELAELSDPPMSKSAINHRMRKLMELSGLSDG